MTHAEEPADDLLGEMPASGRLVGRDVRLAKELIEPLGTAAG